MYVCTYRCPGLLQSDEAALLESSSSSFDVAIDAVRVSPGDKLKSFGFSMPTRCDGPLPLPPPPPPLPAIVIGRNDDDVEDGVVDVAVAMADNDC